MPELVELLQAFRFGVTLTQSGGNGRTGAPLGTGGFAECSGLDIEADIKEYLEGGRNDGVVRRVGRVKLVPLVLKRGMFAPTRGGAVDSALWDWITAVVEGRRPIPRYDGYVDVHGPQVALPGTARARARWRFERGLPLKVTGPSLNARTGEIAIEELHVAHEGLRMERPS
jgi:phage tail-like protein